MPAEVYEPRTAGSPPTYSFHSPQISFAFSTISVTAVEGSASARAERAAALHLTADADLCFGDTSHKLVEVRSTDRNGA